MNQHSHTGWLTDMTERIADLKRDLAAAQAERDGVIRERAALRLQVCDLATMVDDERAKVERLNKLSEAISRDCNATALERDEARADAVALREQYGRLCDIFRVNMLRAFPDKSHAEIDAAIDAARKEGA